MKAVTYMGRNTVEVQQVPDPTLMSPRDAIVKVTTAAICGSDLHLVDGYIPTMRRGDILGHEFMGEIADIGSSISNLRVGDRVVVPFDIACGSCLTCEEEKYSVCENSNPNSWMEEKLFGHAAAGAFGYSHLTGGYAGGQAEYVRVPFADVNSLKIPDGLDDEQVLFLGDILSTGYMGADMCEIKPGHTIAIWGAGPVGQFAARSAFLLGAERVIVIDRFGYRLQKAAESGAVTLNYEEVDVAAALKDLTGGRGPDGCIDAVGMEAHYPGPLAAYDRVKQAMRMETDRPYALRQAIMCCRNGGIIAVLGVYGGFIDKFPMGAVMNRGLTIKSAQTPVQKYMGPLLERITAGEIEPATIITHRMRLDEAPQGYDIFKNKQDECLKVILKP